MSNQPPIQQTLIEKLEERRSIGTPCGIWNSCLDDCIAIIRQHQAEQPQDVVEAAGALIESYRFAKEGGRPLKSIQPNIDVLEEIIAAMGDAVASATIAPLSVETAQPITPAKPGCIGWPDCETPECSHKRPVRCEICVNDDNFMTVVFDRSVVNFDKNPMHIKSEFGNVVAISRGDALSKLDAMTTEPVSGIGWPIVIRVKDTDGKWVECIAREYVD